MDSVLISSPVGEKEIKRGDGSGTRGEGGGGGGGRLPDCYSGLLPSLPGLLL